MSGVLCEGCRACGAKFGRLCANCYIGKVDPGEAVSLMRKLETERWARSREPVDRMNQAIKESIKPGRPAGVATKYSPASKCGEAEQTYALRCEEPPENEVFETALECWVKIRDRFRREYHGARYEYFKSRDPWRL